MGPQTDLVPASYPYRPPTLQAVSLERLLLITRNASGLAPLVESCLKPASVKPTNYRPIAAKMFLGCGIMFVGPRKSHGRPRAKVYHGVGIMLCRPRFMSRRKTSNARSDGHSSSDKLLPTYTDTSEESSPDGLPEVLASFDPHEFNPGELLKRFRAARSRERSRERRSGAPSVESLREEKCHRGNETVNKE